MAELSPQCFVESSSFVKNMPPVRNQGSTPFCYGFVVTQTLQHLLCEQKNINPCKNEISVLDIIKKGNGGSLGNGGYSEDVLGQVKNLSVAKESCAPFSLIIKNAEFNNKTDPEKYFPINQWKKEFNKAYEESQMCNCDYQTRLKTANQLKELMNLQASAEEIVEALRLKSSERALAQILIPKKCNSDQITLPPFDYKTDLVSDKLSMRKIIISKITQQKPVIARLCANTLDNLKDKCEHHVLLITGLRKVCCGGGCYFEYRLHDSNRTEEYWSKEDMFYSQVHRMMQEPSMTKQVSFIWLESKSKQSP